MARNFLTSLRLVNISSDPPTGNEGELYYNTTTDKVRLYSNGAWIDLVAASAGSLFNVDAIAYPDYIAFDTTPELTSASVGTISWNAGEGGLDSQISTNTAITLGQEVISLAYNAEATTLNKGEVVYLFGAQGQRPSVKRASNLSDATSAKTFGMVAESIASGAEGFVMCQGIVKNINTNSYNEGDVLWLGSSAGTVTTTKPYAPNHGVFVGVVVKKNASSGRVFVKPQNGYEMDELHDVYAQSPSDNDILSYVSASTMWVKKNLATAITEVDGTGSNIDADLLDGQHGSYYLNWTNITNKPSPTITLTGDVSGSATFTNVTSASVSVTIQPDSVALGTDTTGNYVASVTGTDGVSITGTGEGAAVTIANTDKGSSQNIFKNISDGTNIAVADSNNDTFTMSAGTGIVVSINASTDTATISNTGVTSLSGTTNEINVSASTGAITLTIPSAIARLASPTFTGIPAGPTASADTNTTQLATTAFVIGQAASSNPIMNGTVAIGTSLRYARQDHVHPTDTSRAPLASPTFTGTVTADILDLTTAATATTATSYWVETGSDGILRPKTLANTRTEIVTTAAVNAAAATTVGTITSGTWNAGIIGLTYGGTNANLTAINGGVVYSTGSAMAITAAGTAGQVLTSNGASAPTWQAASSSGATINEFFLSGM